MASTPSQLLIVCPHCCHAMTEQEGQLHCRSCHVVWPLPAWQGSSTSVARHEDRRADRHAA